MSLSVLLFLQNVYLISFEIFIGNMLLSSQAV